MSKRKTHKTTERDQWDALQDIDRVFHEKARLGIMTAIVGAGDGLSFTDLKSLCQLTDGNLNRHLKVLVDAKVLSVRKTGQGRATLSHYRITSAGRRAFDQYLQALEQILLAAKSRQSKTQPQNSATTSKPKGQLGLEG